MELFGTRRAGRGLLAAISVASLAAVASCGTPASQKADASSGPITVGISLPLTGDFSQPGTAAKKGYEIWQQEVNNNGGLLGRKVKLDITDDASSQDTVVSDYTRLITQDKVDLLLGTFSSLLNFPASAVAEKNHMAYVEPAGGSPEMFTRGFKGLFFAQQATAPHQPDQFVKWVQSLPASQRPKTAAYVTQDDPFTQPVIDSLRKQLSALGVKTVYSKVYPADTTNFQTTASAIAAKKPDLIAQGAVFEDGVSLVRDLEQIGYTPKALFQTSAPSEAEQYSSGIGKANTEGVFYPVSWNVKASTPNNAQFVKDYHAKFGNGTPAEDTADAYAAAEVLQKAVEATKTLDQAKIEHYLHGHTVQTILGPLSWDKTGAPQSAFLLAQWQSGAVQIVAPKAAATTSKVVYPKPAWQ